MPTFDWTALVGQLGASAIFAAALVVVVRAFYNHLMDDQKRMIDRITYLEAKVDRIEGRVNTLQ